MKKLKFLLLVLGAGVVFSACSSKTNESNLTKAPKKVDTLMMSKDTVDARIAKIMSDYVMSLRNDLLGDTTVLNTIGQTQMIVQSIEQKKVDKAKSELKTLIGTLEVYLTKNPKAALVPVDVSYHKVETVDNIDTANAIAKIAEKAVKDGYYQIAKDVLGGLTSEMVINTAYMPITDYLDGLKVAAALLDDNKINKAMVVMQTSLSKILVTSVVIPLPILRAEVMISEAANIDAKGHEHIEQVENLLDNADYQIRLAEALGYGKRDAEFKELYDAIKVLKKSVNKKADSQTAFKGLEKKLKKFEQRLFPIKK